MNNAANNIQAVTSQLRAISQLLSSLHMQEENPVDSYALGQADSVISSAITQMVNVTTRHIKATENQAELDARKAEEEVLAEEVHPDPVGSALEEVMAQWEEEKAQKVSRGTHTFDGAMMSGTIKEVVAIPVAGGKFRYHVELEGWGDEVIRKAGKKYAYVCLHKITGRVYYQVDGQKGLPRGECSDLWWFTFHSRLDLCKRVNHYWHENYTVTPIPVTLDLC